MQQYIVTTRGRNRQYGVLVSVDGPHDGDLHKAAHEKARAMSQDIRDFGTEISAFEIGSEKAKKWSDLEAQRLDAEAAQDWTALRSIREAQSRFLNSL